MEKLWSIRMRASKKAPGGGRPAVNREEIHISGAEGLYPAADLQRVLKRYCERALHHPKGKPDTIVLTLEEIQEKPHAISTLPLSTVMCASPPEARRIARNLLQAVGISEKALKTAFTILQKGGMRGAALVSAEKGVRLEPDRRRGVRVSRLGTAKPASGILSSRLARFGMNSDTVKEALVLASKVASCSGVSAEVCISDDPHYTTGYVASELFGYVRIPACKRSGQKTGGRVFFIQEGSDIAKIIRHLERRPVLVDRIGPCKGMQPAGVILDRLNR